MNFTFEWEDMTIVGKTLFGILLVSILLVSIPIIIFSSIFGFIILLIEFILHLVGKAINTVADWLDFISDGY